MKTRFSTLLLTGILSLCLVAAALALASRSDQSAVAAHLDLNLPQPQSSPPQRSPQTYQPQPPGRAAAPLQPAMHTSPGSSIAELMRQQVMAASPSVALPDGVEMSQSLQPAAPASPQGLAGSYVNAGLTVDLTTESLYGRVAPGVTITAVRQSDGAYGAALSDSGGFFWTSLFAGAGSGSPVGLDSGDVLDLDIDGTAFSITAPAEVVGGLDLDSDTVYGAIPGDNGGTVVTITIGLWNQTSNLYNAYSAVTDSNGYFSVQANQDLGAENFAQAEYLSAGAYSRNALFPNPHALLVWQNSSAGGYAPRGSHVNLRVFVGSSTNIRWEGSTDASFPFGWWQLDFVDMAPGDTMSVDYEDGTNTGLEYVYASGFTFDTAADTVSGMTEPGEDVHAILFGDQVYETETTADGSGAFTASFNSIVDLLPRHRVDIVIHDSFGDQSHMISGPPFVEAILDAESDSDCIFGRVDVPNAPITVSLTSGGTTYTRTNPTWPSDPGNYATLEFCYLIWGPDWGPINFAPGDIVTLSSPSWQGQVTVADLTWQADTASEQVSGNAPAGDLEVTLNQWRSNEYPDHGSATAHASGSPAYTAQFTNFDVRDGGSVEVRHYDPASDFATRLVDSLHYLQVNAPKSVFGHTPIPNEGITAYLYDDLGTLLASTSSDHDGNPYYFHFTDFNGYDILPGYRVDITSDSGWAPSVVVPDITIQGDLNQDLIYGEAPKSQLMVEASPDPSSPAVSFFTPVDGYALNVGWLGYDLVPGDHVFATYSALDGSRVRYSSCMAEICRVESWSNFGWETWFWGYAEPGSVVTFTAPHDPQVITAYADPACDGCFNTNEATPLYPGESVTVIGGAGTQPVVITQPDPYVAHSDSWAGEVSGQLGGWANLFVEVNPWGWGDPQTVQSDANGNFSAAYAGMPNNAQGHIRFMGSDGATQVIQHKPFKDLSLQIRANYNHEWVEGDYEPGHTLWITLTDSLGQIKDTASGVSGVIPEWGNNSGFTTWGNTPWASGSTPDLEVGDYVYARSDVGYTADLRIGEIDAVLDVNADTISGTINAGWLVSPTNGSCGIWIENGPGIGFNNIDPNGGSFFCDFAALGYDIIPGMDVGVEYREPGQHDDDQIYNVLREPAPHLWIQTWGEGNPGEGSNYILAVQYNNDGDASASSVTVSMTLLEGMSYITDTSGLPVSGTGAPGDPLVWDVGVLQPNTQFQPPKFQVFVQVTGAAGTLAKEQAQINTTQAYLQGDPWNMLSSWEGNIQAQDIELSVGKSTWTWDPVPGGEFVYNLDACSNASTNSGMVILTDTLPLSTTLVSWWGEQPGWQEVSASPHELVVSRPSLQSYWCGRVNIKVSLDPAAWPGMQLHNLAQIWGANDSDLNNNTAELWHNVGSPHPNLHINKNWIWGRLVPGGTLQFEFNTGNSGNIPVDNVLVTATLPAGTTFEYAYSWDWSGSFPFPPSIVTDDTLVWDFGQLPNGYSKDIGVRLAIDPAIAVGAALPITVSVTRLLWEDRFDDNQRSWLEVVNPLGPNLRVDKHSNWRWNWLDNLYFEPRIMNLGTTRLQDFWITETLPANTTVQDFRQNHGPYSEWTVDDANGMIYIHVIDPMDPENSASFHLELRPDDAVIGVPGLGFTDTLDAPIAGDIFPQDNHDEVVTWSGSDIYVNKWLSEGTPRAGEEVTFTVEFGNSNKWPIDGNTPYGSHITDTLPAGLTFLRATAPWNAVDTWDPESIDGQTVRWGWSPMWAETQWHYEIVAQVTSPMTGALTLSNHVEAYSDNPDEYELDWTNNAYDAPFTTLGPNFQVSKDYLGNAVAGTALTYTLAVENTGNETGTNLAVIDWIPDWFTYLGGGDDYNAGLVTWNVPSLAAGAQASPSFWGTLSCTAGGVVSNQYYRVDSSDQGIDSPDGAPVSFTIAAPQIAAGFSASSAAVLPGQPVDFTSTATTDGTPLSFAWDFADGGSASGASASHAFDTPGTYTVTLTATDACGFSDTSTMEINVAFRKVFMPLLIRQAGN